MHVSVSFKGIGNILSVNRSEWHNCFVLHLNAPGTMSRDQRWVSNNVTNRLRLNATANKQVTPLVRETADI